MWPQKFKPLNKQIHKKHSRNKAEKHTGMQTKDGMKARRINTEGVLRKSETNENV